MDLFPVSEGHEQTRMKPVPLWCLWTGLVCLSRGLSSSLPPTCPECWTLLDTNSSSRILLSLIPTMVFPLCCLHSPQSPCPCPALGVMTQVNKAPGQNRDWRCSNIRIFSHARKILLTEKQGKGCQEEWKVIINLVPTMFQADKKCRTCLCFYIHHHSPVRELWLLSR